MNNSEINYHWVYFKTLCSRLETTQSYVSHQIKFDNELTQKDVFSSEFEQIIILASIEFENVSKLICKTIKPDFDMKWANIKKITETILSRYPHIKETEIFSPFQVLKPLENWIIENETNPETGKINKKVKGVTWWETYDDLKHQGYSVFEKANLKNAVDSLAALMVLELYYMKITLDDLSIAGSNPCEYFQTKYVSGGNGLFFELDPLPDFAKSQSQQAVSEMRLLVFCLCNPTKICMGSLSRFRKGKRDDFHAVLTT